MPRETYEDALRWYEITAQRFVAFAESKGTDKNAEQDVINSVPPGLYVHWKSKEKSLKFYVVESAFMEVDVYTPMVIYRALYPPHAGKPSGRHLLNEERGFLMPIDRDGYRGPRFKLIDPLSREEITILLNNVETLSTMSRSEEFLKAVSLILGRPVPRA